MRSSASQTLLPATQRRCTETVAAMARRKRRLAPQRNHTDSVITFYNRDTEKARDKMGNKMKKFRQISTKAHRTGHRGKNKRTRSAARGREKAAALLIYTTLASFTLCRAWARKGGPPPFKASETEQLPYRAWTRKNRAVLRGSALLRANNPKRRCKTLLSHAKWRLATRRQLCCLALRWVSSGSNPVEKGKKQVQVPIFAGFEQKDVMTRLPYRNAP